MAFNSVNYLVFLAAVALAYYRLRPAWRVNLLLGASWAFYASYSIWFVWLLAFSTLFAYATGLKIAATDDPRARRRWVTVSVVGNLAVLGFYKYPAFLLGNLGAALAVAHLTLPTLAIQVVLPLGISFYTFEAISYNIDIYRRHMAPVRSLREFALFLSFFPHLVAGPIIRAPELIAQLTGRTGADGPTARRGLALFVYGMAKKVFLADAMAALVGEVYGAPDRYSGASLAAATYAFAVQIYCDFSGYSDMAIGSALLLGIKLPDNFARPYLALSISEFWTRWHMTLSRWLRDYLYIPLGGNRRGPARTRLNLMLTMLLGGLWHGAGWNWVVWGGLQGAAMAAERALGLDRPAAGRPWRALRWLVTFHVVCVSWIFFRARTLGEAGQIIGRIAALAPGEIGGEARSAAYAVLGLALVFAGELAGTRERWLALLAARPATARWVAYAALLVLVLTFTRAAHPEFIYFAF